MNKRIIFTHIPKCGGTTLHTILNRFYLPEESFHIKRETCSETFHSLSDRERHKIKLLKGHFLFGLHTHFSDDSEYITLLRNPVERVISYYYYLKRTPGHRLYRLGLFNQNMSLHDFVTNINEDDIHNAQIKMISGIIDREEIMLEKAMENIDKHYSFVGTLEKFDESLIFLKKIYSWSIPYYQIRNKTLDRPLMNEIDPNTIREIELLNAGDIQLYQHIDSKLNHMIENDNSLPFELFKLRVLSKVFKFKKEKQSKIAKLMSERTKSLVKRIISY